MNRKTVILGVLIVILAAIAAAAAFIFYISRRGPLFLATDGPDFLPRNEYPQLEGKWVETDSSDPNSFTIEESKCLYTREGKQAESSFTVSEDDAYNLSLENNLTLNFEQGEGPVYCDEYVYHTEEKDGHTIHIMDSFMYEDDGRGLIVYMEFVHSDDLQYVGNEFCSKLYNELNLREAPATYLEVDPDAEGVE